ncbi:hypothetical protein B0H12DRAFT_1097383 [Mycena haematopus]|nr:hypothetical protein B0H12DRAFT_1097383 [Mycena haematopus]
MLQELEWCTDGWRTSRSRWIFRPSAAPLRSRRGLMVGTVISSSVWPSSSAVLWLQDAPTIDSPLSMRLLPPLGRFPSKRRASALPPFVGSSMACCICLAVLPLITCIRWLLLWSSFIPMLAFSSFFGVAISAP